MVKMLPGELNHRGASTLCSSCPNGSSVSFTHKPCSAALFENFPCPFFNLKILPQLFASFSHTTVHNKSPADTDPIKLNHVCYHQVRANGKHLGTHDRGLHYALLAGVMLMFLSVARRCFVPGRAPKLSKREPKWPKFSRARR